VLRFGIRDLLIVAAAVALWRLDGSRGEDGALGWTVALLTGVGTALVGFLMHEWGHLAGSLLSGSTVDFPKRLITPLLFHFDSAKNDRRQFFWMSAGGYLASLIALAGIALLCPLSTRAGRVALGLGSLGVLATFTLELPITWKVWRGAPLPMGAAYRPHQD
jgi:hypothetical protein